MAKPFLKWAGGKKFSTDIILHNLPNKCPNKYYEPFFGGGAVFFALKNAKRIKHAILSDINEELITTCNAIKNDVNGVISAINDLQPASIDLDKYNHIRASSPISPVERAARMIFLNKTCFNGLYRVNKSNIFNVPYSKREFWIPDFDNLKDVSKDFQGVDLIHSDYTIAKQASQGDIVYFDPPYLPLSKTSNFVSYSNNGFTLSDQKKLATLFAELSEKGVALAASNSDHPGIHEIYENIPGVRFEKINIRRAINSDPTKRSPVSELLIISNSLVNSSENSTS